MQYHRPAMYQAAFDVSGVCTRLHIVIFVGLICIKKTDYLHQLSGNVSKPILDDLYQ